MWPARWWRTRSGPIGIRWPPRSTWRPRCPTFTTGRGARRCWRSRYWSWVRQRPEVRYGGGQMDVISNTVRNVRLARDYSHRLHLRDRMLHIMSTSVESATERSAEEVNEEIRALWLR